MKNSIFLLLTGSLFLACNEAPKSNVTVVDEEVAEELPNFSEVDFDAALIAYKSGKYKEAGRHIEAAIKDLETESVDLSKEAKEQVNKSLATLNDIEAKIKKGKIADIAEMEKAFVQVETSLAHDYLFVSSVYAIGQPTKAKKTLEKSIKRMESASKKLKGESKETAGKMVKEGKDLLAKDTELAEEWSIEAKNLVKKMNVWRKEHQSELFYDSRRYYPYNF